VLPVFEDDILTFFFNDLLIFFNRLFLFPVYPINTLYISLISPKRLFSEPERLASDASGFDLKVLNVSDQEESNVLMSSFSSLKLCHMCEVLKGVGLGTRGGAYRLWETGQSIFSNRSRVE
jgi:hypothetical protein